jgi:GNAT superfamily N-acetyltransferase
MIELRSIKFDAEAIAAYARLFEACFPNTRKFNEAYLRWLYSENPFGHAVGFDAWDGDSLAAHYVGVPLQVRLERKEVMVLLSLNTATHPRYQGKGLFTKLAERTYDAAGQLGYSAIIGVANANSTPGFTRKLGFQLVEPLAARIGIGPLALSGRRESDAQLRTTWTASALAWRCQNPNNQVFVRPHDFMVQVYARGVRNLVHAYAELPRDHLDPAGVPISNERLSPLRLYLGLEPGHTRTGTYVDIPHRFRPSPLNFIYRPLTTSLRELNRGAISFSFIDFDAY